MADKRISYGESGGERVETAPHCRVCACVRVLLKIAYGPFKWLRGEG